jgi:hypothetical protein
MLFSSVVKNHLAQLLPLLKPIAILPLPPRAPFNLRALGGSSGNTLSWEDIPGADGYELQMSTNGDFSSATTISSGTSTSFTDVTHSAGTKRWYRLRGFVRTRQTDVVPGPWSAPIVSTSGSNVTTYDQVTHTPAWQAGKRPSAISVRVSSKARS